MLEDRAEQLIETRAPQFCFVWSYGSEASSGTARAVSRNMNAVSNDNGQVEVQHLEVRFHPHGRAHDYVVIGMIVCQGGWAVCELAEDLGRRLPDSCSIASVTANLRYLTIISRPRTFETLRALDSAHWSFVPTKTKSTFDL